MKVEIKHTVLGTHKWSACPFDEVKFLRNEHHHDFTIRVETEVKHDDREIEFIKLRIELIKFLKSGYKTINEITRFNEKSCEQISNEIKQHLEVVYPTHDFKVNVSEDEVYRGGEW